MELVLAHNIVGTMTVSASIVGLVLALFHYKFYTRVDSKLSNALKRVFLSDALIYATTISFGVWAFFEASFGTALWLHIIRVPIILLNIVAALNLYKMYSALTIECKNC